MPERYAIYYAPARTSALWQRACEWLGRDPADGGAATAQISGIDPARRLELTLSARRYGFHATMKATKSLKASLAHW